MGGSAFSSLPDPPYTPRMPPAVYHHVRSACHAALRELFVYVATPIEGPGKKDHGDVDVLVALERRVAFPRKPGDSVGRPPVELMEEIKRLLSADHAIVHPAGTSANLAVRWPSEADVRASTDGKVHRGGDGEADGLEAPAAKYVQVDVRICPDLDRLCWTLFKNAHGDLWNILGSTIRPYGLTVDEEALWLRIPEIERFDRKQAKVRLTRDPVEILHFLGMKVDGFWAEPFESVEALFDYATTCRLFWVQEAPEGDAEGGGNGVGVVGGEEGRRKLKSNDRRRMNSRPVYRRWITEFIPSLRAKGQFMRSEPGASVDHVRAAVRDEAFVRFFVEAEYKKRLKDWLLKRDTDEMKSLIKCLVPDTLEPQFRSCLVAALRKIVMEDDRTLGITPSSPLRDADGFYDVEGVRSFVQDTWQQVGELAWSRQKQKAAEAMRLKASRKTTGKAGSED